MEWETETDCRSPDLTQTVGHLSYNMHVMEKCHMLVSQTAWVSGRMPLKTKRWAKSIHTILGPNLFLSWHDPQVKHDSQLCEADSKYFLYSRHCDVFPALGKPSPNINHFATHSNTIFYHLTLNFDLGHWLHNIALYCWSGKQLTFHKPRQRDEHYQTYYLPTMQSIKT